MSKSTVRTQCVRYVRNAFKYIISLRVLDSVGLAGLFLSPPWISSVPQSTNDHRHITSKRLRLFPLVVSFSRAIGSQGFSSVDRFHGHKDGLKRLVKVERKLAKKRKRKARRHKKSYPGKLVHFDSVCLSLIKGKGQTLPKEHLFVAVDDFSRELYAGLFPDNSQCSSELFLRQVSDKCPYSIECAYSDNGKEFRGASGHAFVKACFELGIRQKFSRIYQPQSKCKTERVLETIMEMWRRQKAFQSRKNRQISLLLFINSYNTVKPQKGINNMTPDEKLREYFYGVKR